jgi:hypothetical protein
VKRILLLLLISLLPSVVHASDLTTDRPHWSFEMKAGRLTPDIENWSSTYGDRDTTEFGAAAAYKITRHIEAGIEGGYSRSGGSGFAPIHQQAAGHVILNLYPVDVFILARGVFTEYQWLVPYVGGGFSRVFYREEVENQGVARGYANGYHARGGLQFLLDIVDQEAANGFYRDFGVRHTYLFVETKYTRAMADTVASGTVNIGGTAWLLGLLFEF